MIKMLAIAPEDGWAYVQINNKIQLIRPPYTKSSSSVVSIESVETAITRYGFRQSDKKQDEFADWASLINHLNSLIVSSRKARGVEAPDNIGDEMLELAPEKILKEFLERIENELIPDFKWNHAEMLLIKMLKLQSFCENSDLHNKAIELLDKVNLTREQREKNKNVMATEDIEYNSIFRLTYQRYGKENVDKMTKDIYSRGLVFAF
jgi:hypothetical protein